MIKYIRQSGSERDISKLIFPFLLIAILFAGTFNGLKAQSNDDCLMCHEDESLTMEKKGREISLFVNPTVLNNSTHKNLNCVSCHVGFDPEEFPHKENIQPIDCKLCHKDAPTKHPFHPQMLRAVGSNGTRDVSCKNCHGTHDVKSPQTKESKWHASNLISSCGSCHKNEKEIYTSSQHYIGLTGGVKGTPDCITCHQNPIVTDTQGTDTLKVKIAQEKLCLSCHLDDPQIRARTSPSAGFITAYEHSIHGSELMKGNSKVANCVNCHTSHDVEPGSNSTSTVNKLNIPETCGQCHKDISEEYSESIHGVSLMKGNMDSPACVDCHGEH
ncbi:MAG: cytochrome B, partial [Ignavibacteriales bacterium]